MTDFTISDENMMDMATKHVGYQGETAVALALAHLRSMRDHGLVTASNYVVDDRPNRATHDRHNGATF